LALRKDAEQVAKAARRKEHMKSDSLVKPKTYERWSKYHFDDYNIEVDGPRAAIDVEAYILTEEDMEDLIAIFGEEVVRAAGEYV
jgi:hypothetical protein